MAWNPVGVVPGEIRSITLNGIDYGVVGVLDKVALDPNLDNAAFVTQWAADHDFATEGEPTKSEALGHQEFILTYKSFEPLGPACFPSAA